MSQGWMGAIPTERHARSRTRRHLELWELLCSETGAGLGERGTVFTSEGTYHQREECVLLGGRGKAAILRYEPAEFCHHCARDLEREHQETLRGLEALDSYAGNLAAQEERLGRWMSWSRAWDGESISYYARCYSQAMSLKERLEDVAYYDGLNGVLNGVLGVARRECMRLQGVLLDLLQQPESRRVLAGCALEDLSVDLVGDECVLLASRGHSDLYQLCLLAWSSGKASLEMEWKFSIRAPRAVGRLLGEHCTHVMTVEDASPEILELARELWEPEGSSALNSARNAVAASKRILD